MESRFAHLRQRDNSVSMLRVKMSRRRSQSQKENRERNVNKRRQLDMVQELELSSIDTSIAMGNMSIIQEKTLNNTKLAKNAAGEERLKQLQRWKERKALEREKEKREKERKGVFKTGLYHPKDTRSVGSLPPVSAATGRIKETKVILAPPQSTRVTRSMKQQQVQKPLRMQDVNTAATKVQHAVERTTKNCGPAPKPTVVAPLSKNKVEPVTRGLSTRSTNKPLVTAVPVVKDKPKDKCAHVRTTRSKAVCNKVPPFSIKEKNCQATARSTVKPPIPEESITEPDSESKNQGLEQNPPPSPPLHSEMEDLAVDQSVADSAPAEDVSKSLCTISSFAPEGFVFKAPVGVSSFKFAPLTPRSADAFLTPSPSFILPPAPTFNDESEAEVSKPSPPKSPRRSPPQTHPTVADTLTEVLLESKHDVPYFRSEITNETDRLTSLCECWEPKVEDESIPEEMRDRMRTAVGQARLLMKERFNQFSGLVDDCEFGRGEKITTCTDLQGFWDMVYFQVEDVNKKFDALKEAEARSWVEEHKPPPRQKKVVKKPAAAPAKPTGTKAAAKSRLAAAKAAMKARQQAAESEQAAQAAGATENTSQSSEEVQAPSEAQMPDTVVFNGGFFRVESPAKPPGSLRKSSRLSGAVLPQPSPSSNYLSPRRVTRRSLALAQTPSQTAQPCLVVNKTPAQAPKSQPATPQTSKSSVNVSLHFSPVKEVPSENTEPTEEPLSERGNTIPSISVVEEQDKPVEASCSELNLSSHLSQSPCKSPIKSQTPVPSAAMSFTLSPCKPWLSSPGVSCTPRAVENVLNTQDSTRPTPDSSVNEEIPGFDFERYLQPSQRESLSPREPFAMESSPMAMDVEMESPRGQSEDQLTQQETVVTTLPVVPTLFSQSPQTAESALLLFTPDLKERIRQSVCPTDLMVFTPPNL